MQLTVHSEGGQTHVIAAAAPSEWTGTVDLVGELSTALAGKPVRNVILDLGGVNYVNSLGLGSIFTLRAFVRQGGGTLVLARPNPSVHRLLDIVNMKALIPIAADLEAARTVIAAGGAASA